MTGVKQRIQFPAADERTWRDISRSVRAALSPSLESHVIDCILADLEPRFMKITASFTYTFQCPPACQAHVQHAVEAFEKFLHEYSAQWLLQMVTLAAERYAEQSG